VDTSVMEYTAEDLISHKLQRGGILVAKPKFDQAGGDLIGLLNVDDGAKFCRIQCKGRSFRNLPHTGVDVPVQYATNAFILFLFLETGDMTVTNLFCFFGFTIAKTWNRSQKDGREVFRLSLNVNTFANDLSPYRFEDSTIESIKKLIRHANLTDEFTLVTTGQLAVTLAPLTCQATGTVRSPDR
jgi:hypothetical protein